MHVIETLGSIIATNGKKEWNDSSDELITCQSAVTRCWDEQGFSSSDCSKMLIIFLLKIFVFEKHKQTTKIFFLHLHQKKFSLRHKNEEKKTTTKEDVFIQTSNAVGASCCHHTHTHTHTHADSSEKSSSIRRELARWNRNDVLWGLQRWELRLFLRSKRNWCNFRSCSLVEKQTKLRKEEQIRRCQEFNTEKYRKIISPKIDSKVSFLLFSHREFVRTTSREGVKTLSWFKNFCFLGQLRFSFFRNVIRDQPVRVFDVECKVCKVV